ncbi:MAG: 7-carboxy-7-deazaguanine synthase [Hyphomicrobiaceae bacterium]|nr:7-carboxy-7-deazaguanine synthase [Hyphomicrobiaceae bacterium]
MYHVKEIFYTLQGEGANAGRPAIFCRFAGCNLWSGLEADRATADCRFCDTDFVGTDGIGGGKYRTAGDLVEAAINASGEDAPPVLIVLTGGEPMLQVDGALIDALHDEGFEIAIETNGTLIVPRAIDWICVSPKAGTTLVQRSGDELKVVYPQAGLMPDTLAGLDFRYRFLQPMDGPELAANTAAAVDYCKSNPEWRLSLQTHKMIGIP